MTNNEDKLLEELVYAFEQYNKNVMPKEIVATCVTDILMGYASNKIYENLLKKKRDERKKTLNKILLLYKKSGLEAKGFGKYFLLKYHANSFSNKNEEDSCVCGVVGFLSVNWVKDFLKPIVKPSKTKEENLRRGSLVVGLMLCGAKESHAEQDVAEWLGKKTETIRKAHLLFEKTYPNITWEQYINDCHAEAILYYANEIKKPFPRYKKTETSFFAFEKLQNEMKSYWDRE